MLVQEITPAMGDALVKLFEQLAALLASGYTTLRSAEFRLRILVDSRGLNLSAIRERRKCGDTYVYANRLRTKAFAGFVLKRVIPV
jgi:hypothetical protein